MEGKQHRGPEELYEGIKRLLGNVHLDPHTPPKLNNMIESIYHMLLIAREEARTDALTQLPNLRGLSEILEREEASANRYKNPLSLGFLDFNNLRDYNKRYGHPQANHAIVSIANVIKRSLRTEDIVGRYGGDEFCIVLPNTDFNNAEIIIGRVTQELSELSIESVVGKLPDNAYSTVTISGGYTTLKRNEDYRSALVRANNASIVAKAKSKKNENINTVIGV